MAWANTRAPINGGSNLRSFEHFTGTRVEVLEGTGEPGDPYYVATVWFDEKGCLIRASSKPSEETHER